MQVLPKTLVDFEKLIWERIARGAVDKKDPFQVLTLISIRDNLPNPRSVILRKVDVRSKELFFHSDMRASKIDDISQIGEVSVHGWHPRNRLQLRIKGVATLHHSNSLWEEEWSRLSPTSKLNYSSDLNPGLPIERPEEGWNSYAVVEEIEKKSESWKSNFCVISFKVSEIEGLILSRGKHLRANFTWVDSTTTSTWLVP